MGLSIKYVSKIFRKTNISDTLWYAHVRACIRGLEMLVFWKILRTYLVDGPYASKRSSPSFASNIKQILEN